MIFAATTVNPSHQFGWRQVVWLLEFPTTWGMFLGFFGVVYISWFYATWLPGYLESGAPSEHCERGNVGGNSARRRFSRRGFRAV